MKIISDGTSNTENIHVILDNGTELKGITSIEWISNPMKVPYVKITYWARWDDGIISWDGTEEGLSTLIVPCCKAEIETIEAIVIKNLKQKEG